MHSLYISRCFTVTALIAFHYNLVNFLRPLSPPSCSVRHLLGERPHSWFQPLSGRSLKYSDLTLHSCFWRLANLKLYNHQYFYQNTISGKITSQAYKDPNMTLRPGYPLPDYNLVFQYHGEIIIIIIIIFCHYICSRT